MAELRFLLSLAIFVFVLSPQHNALQLRRYRRIATVPRQRPRGFAPALTGSLGHWFASGTSTTGNDKFSGNRNVTSAALQAAEFRRKAEQLKAEAASLELSLSVAKLQASQRKAADIAQWMEALFLNGQPRTPEAVARIIHDNRYSESQLSTLVDALHSQGEQEATEQWTRKNATPATMEEPIALTYIQLLLDATKILDNDNNNGNRRWSGRVHSTLQTQLKELSMRKKAQYQRELVAHVTKKVVLAAKGNTTNSSTTMGTSSTSNPLNLQQTSQFALPTWIPPGLVAEVNASSSPLLKADLSLLQNSVLPQAQFSCVSVESITNAAIFRGSVRRGKKDTSIEGSQNNFYANIQRELRKEPGLSDRVRLFYLKDPQWRPKTDGDRPQPVVLAIPQHATVLAPSRSRLLYAAAAVASLTTTTLFAISSYALNPQFYSAIVHDHNLGVVATSCWPMVCGLVAVHAVHETIHHFVARRHGLQLQWPLPLPSFALGTLGCSTGAPRSFPANRTAVLDVSLSGPVASMALSVALVTLGCRRTVRASEATLLAYPFVTAGSLRSSVLVGTILTLLIPKLAVLHGAQPVPIHPLVLVGWSGMVASAFHLMPILRLDGGRACTAAMGSRFAAVATAWALLMMVSCGPRATVWALTIVLLHRRPEVNALDEVTPVGRWRVRAWLTSVVVAAAALLPFPGTRGIF